MTDIYYFHEYRSPDQWRPPSGQTQEVIRELYDLKGHLNGISAGVLGIQKAQHSFSLELDVHLLKLERSNEFSRQCIAACEVKSFEQMIKIRDQLIRDLARKNAPPTRHARRLPR